MQTLTYGFEKPETGDKGSVFFPALEEDIQQLNDHTHNGTDSALLTAASSLGVVQDIGAATWGSPDDFGIYSQIITMPTIMLFDNYNISTRDSVSGIVLALEVVKASTNTFTVFCNDNTIVLRIVYT